jgi:hypothetical protein
VAVKLRPETGSRVPEGVQLLNSTLYSFTPSVVSRDAWMSLYRAEKHALFSILHTFLMPVHHQYIKKTIDE